MTFAQPAPPSASPQYTIAVKKQEKNYFEADSQLFRLTQKEARFIPNVEDRSAILKAIHDEVGH